jgi:hypothetical protein
MTESDFTDYIFKSKVVRQIVPEVKESKPRGRPKKYDNDAERLEAKIKQTKESVQRKKKEREVMKKELKRLKAEREAHNEIHDDDNLKLEVDVAFSKFRNKILALVKSQNANDEK